MYLSHFSGPVCASCTLATFLSWNFECVRDSYDGFVPDLMRTSILEVAMYLSYYLVAFVPYVAASRCLLVAV